MAGVWTPKEMKVLGYNRLSGGAQSLTSSATFRLGLAPAERWHLIDRVSFFVPASINTGLVGRLFLDATELSNPGMFVGYCALRDSNVSRKDGMLDFSSPIVVSPGEQFFANLTGAADGDQCYWNVQYRICQIFDAAPPVAPAVYSVMPVGVHADDVDDNIHSHQFGTAKHEDRPVPSRPGKRF